MALVNLPMALSAASWDKQKSALQKAAKPPATKLPDELKELSKLHLGLDWSEFSGDKLRTADEVGSSLDELDKAEKGKIKALLAQLQAVEKAAASFESEAKKDKAFPKEPLAAVAAIIKAAKDYRGDVDSAVGDARKGLESKAKEFAQKASGGAGNPALAKQTKLLKSRLLTSIALLRKPQPNARPTRFMIALGSKGSAGLALGYAVGPAQEKLLKGLMPGEAPVKILKDMKAVVVWEKNALTFVSDRLAGTVLKKVQLWLKKLLKLNLKMRVRKSTGEVEETEGEDVSDELLKVDAADVEAVGKDEFMGRLAGLQADIKASLAGPSAARIKELMASIAQLTKADKYDDADGELDEIEALLAAGDDEDEADEVQAEESASQADDKADAQAAFTRRFAALQPGIKTGLAGPDAARLKELVAGLTQLSKAGKFADAGKVLDGIDKLLKGGGAKTEAKPEPTSATQAKPGADPAAAFNTRLAAVVPQVNALKAKGHAALKDITLKVSEAGALARKKDFAAAGKLLDEAERLLASAGDESEQDEVESDEEGGGARLGEQEFKKQWPAVKASWQDAIDTVNGQIGKLQAALKKTGDAELIEIAEFGLNGVTGNLKTPMMAAVMELDRASGPALKTAAGKAGKIARAFHAYLASEETVAVTDDNEFGVQVTIRTSLGGALRQIEKLTAQLR